MDHAIYGRLGRTDLGVYGTRRYPKGGPGAVVSNPAAIESRAPSTVVLNFGTPAGGVHPQIERWTYTVPDNRKAMIVSAVVEFARNVAGVGNQQINSIILIHRYNSVAAPLIRVTGTDDTLGARAQETFEGGAENCILFAGDRLRGFTGIASGDAGLICAAHLIEFNATEASGRNFAGGEFNPQVGLGLARPSGGINGSGSGSGGLLLPYTSGGGSSYVGPAAKDAAIPIYTWDGRRI